MFGKLLRFARFAGLAAIALATLAITSALLYRAYARHSIAEARLIHSPRGIDSLERVRIGGIDQWIHVRGEDVANPILLFIHGGPGVAFIPMAGEFQGPWESSFTVVQWDQRGAGKTFASNDAQLQLRTMSLQRMEEDTLEVANYLRARFKRDRIFVLGHSWGSVLGLWLAHEHPESVYAYVGVGQLIEARRNEEAGYQDSLRAARESHNAVAVKSLEGIAPYPGATVDFRKSSIVRDWEGRLIGPPPQVPQFMDVTRLLTTLVTSPEYSLADDYAFIQGQKMSLETLIPEMLKVDLSALGTSFRVPLVFLEGRNDPFCRPKLVFEYLQAVDAPHKEFIWFERSGHFPFFEEPARFADALARHVRPLAPRGG